MTASVPKSQQQSTDRQNLETSLTIEDGSSQPLNRMESNRAYLGTYKRWIWGSVIALCCLATAVAFIGAHREPTSGHGKDLSAFIAVRPMSQFSAKSPIASEAPVLERPRFFMPSVARSQRLPKAPSATPSGDDTPTDANEVVELAEDVVELAEEVEELTSESRSAVGKAGEVKPDLKADELQGQAVETVMAVSKAVEDVKNSEIVKAYGEKFQDEEFQRQVKVAGSKIADIAMGLANKAMDYANDPEVQEKFQKTAKDVTAKAQAVVDDLQDPEKRKGFTAKVSQLSEKIASSSTVQEKALLLEEKVSLLESKLEEAKTPKTQPAKSNPASESSNGLFGGIFSQGTPRTTTTTPKPNPFANVFR